MPCPCGVSRDRGCPATAGWVWWASDQGQSVRVPASCRGSGLELTESRRLSGEPELENTKGISSSSGLRHLQAVAADRVQSGPEALLAGTEPRGYRGSRSAPGPLARRRRTHTLPRPCPLPRAPALPAPCKGEEPVGSGLHSRKSLNGFFTLIQKGWKKLDYFVSEHCFKKEGSSHF